MAVWLRGEGPESDVVMSSRVRLARNLAGFPFVPQMTVEDRHNLLDLVRRRCSAGALGVRAHWIDLHSASRLDCTLLVERHLISQQHARGKLSTGKGGPGEPRAVAVAVPGETLSVMVIEEDHLRIQSVKPGLALQDAQAEADEADDRIERQLDYAFSPRFGYLTACPTNVGTGVRLSVMLHLPALRMIGEIEKVKHAAEDMGLAIRGFYGEGSEAIGDLYQLSNQTTLGKSERVLLREMQHEVVPRVVEYERHARRVLLDSRRDSASDTICRALGTLRYARLLTSDEAMQLLSRVRLGVAMGLLADITLPTVNELLLLTQPAHLQRLTGHEMSQRDRRAARAALVRERLSTPTPSPSPGPSLGPGQGPGGAPTRGPGA